MVVGEFDCELVEWWGEGWNYLVCCVDYVVDVVGE